MNIEAAIKETTWIGQTKLSDSKEANGSVLKTVVTCEIKSVSYTHLTLPTNREV